MFCLFKIKYTYLCFFLQEPVLFSGSIKDNILYGALEDSEENDVSFFIFHLYLSKYMNNKNKYKNYLLFQKLCIIN